LRSRYASVIFCLMARYDVIIAGLGAVGSAAAHALAKRGLRVLGLDRFSPPHTCGSSHGETRITRAAIGEGVEYTPLAIRSHALWRELEEVTGDELYVPCGCLTIAGPRGSTKVRGVEGFFANIAQSARRYAVPFEEFASGAAITARFPQFAVAPGNTAFLDKCGGYVRPEKCIAANLARAAHHGATLARNMTVTDFRATAGGVRTTCGDGSSHEAGKLLLATGAWLPAFLGGPFNAWLTVTRQVLFWFEMTGDPSRFAPSRFPVFIWDVNGEHGATSNVYGFPLYEGATKGLKITHEETGQTVDPDDVPRGLFPGEAEHAYEHYIRPFLPALGPRCVRHEVCLYTRAPGDRFIIDWHPAQNRVVFVSACSGHGFKHSAAIGEAAAQMLVDDVHDGKTAHADLAPFSIACFEAFGKEQDLRV
jgi:sarcosine oxidase